LGEHKKKPTPLQHRGHFFAIINTISSQRVFPKRPRDKRRKVEVHEEPWGCNGYDKIHPNHVSCAQKNSCNRKLITSKIRFENDTNLARKMNSFPPKKTMSSQEVLPTIPPWEKNPTPSLAFVRAVKLILAKNIYFFLQKTATIVSKTVSKQKTILKPFVKKHEE